MKRSSGKRTVFVALVSILMVAGAFGLAHANSSVKSQFLSHYGLASSSPLNTCNTCHTSPPIVNPYGQALLNNGFDVADSTTWDPAFVAAETTDSDGDGFTNLVEINAGFFPGDATSHPVATASTPSILWRNAATGANKVWLMSGTTRTGTANLPAMAKAWTMVGAADFNNDGTPDILWRNATTGANRVWFMGGVDGSTRTGTAVLPAMAAAWTMVGAADLDGDGAPDILWRNAATGANRVWLMSGITRTSTANLPAMAAAWTMVGAE